MSSFYKRSYYLFNLGITFFGLEWESDILLFIEVLLDLLVQLSFKLSVNIIYIFGVCLFRSLWTYRLGEVVL